MNTNPMYDARFSIGIFGGFAVLIWLETHLLIPWLVRATGIEPIIFWLSVAGLFLFLPMLVLTVFLLKGERVKGSWKAYAQRCRFRRMNRSDWLWSLGALVLIGVISVVLMKGQELFFGPFDSQPAFMRLEPLGPGRYWILLLWLPYWILNIFGEEILWRGVMLPGQESVFGPYAWLVNGCLWGLFHIAFGWQLLITLIPILLILPYVVQRRQNSWIGVLLHALINGPSFIAIAFGLL